MALSQYEIAINKAKAEKAEKEKKEKAEKENKEKLVKTKSQMEEIETRLDRIRNQEKKHLAYVVTHRTSNDPNLITCAKCGNSISKRADKCPKCNNAVLITCLICNKEIPKSSIECPICGDPSPFDSSSKKLTSIILGATITRTNNLPSQPQEPKTEKPSVTEVQLKSKPGPRGVGGWLLLLVVGMMVLGPLLGAGRINVEIMMAERQYQEITSLEQWKTYKEVTWWIFFAVAAISFYGGWGLARGNAWSAVSRAKAILWITGPGASLVLGALVPIMVFGESSADAAHFVGSIIAAAIWTTYLAKSKRVRNTYGIHSH